MKGVRVESHSDARVCREQPLELAECHDCDSVTVNPQSDRCACGREFYPVTHLVDAGVRIRGHVLDNPERGVKVPDPESAPPLRPGDEVELVAKDEPATAPFITRPIRLGDRGRVVRLVHHRIEGEPLEKDASPVLAHVLLEGQDYAIGFDPKCFRVLGKAGA